MCSSIATLVVPVIAIALCVVRRAPGLAILLKRQGSSLSLRVEGLVNMLTAALIRITRLRAASRNRREERMEMRLSSAARADMVHISSG